MSDSQTSDLRIKVYTLYASKLYFEVMLLKVIEDPKDTFF